MKRMVLYLHGQGGSPAEAERFRSLFPGCEVIGLDYAAQTPWEAEAELPALVSAACGDCDDAALIANSIGAYFAMSALGEAHIAQAFFISPIVDMERLIADMMRWAGVSEDALRAAGSIETDFGQTLSWEYLSYARRQTLRWRVPTRILYGGADHLTAPETVRAFAERLGAPLTVMENGEHWFHTEEQLRFLDRWITDALREIRFI